MCPLEIHLLTADQHKTVRLRTINDSIVNRKADKSNVMVSMDGEMHGEKTDKIFVDDSNNKNEVGPTKNIKNQMQKEITRANSFQDLIHFGKLKGHFDPGCMHANSKITYLCDR